MTFAEIRKRDVAATISQNPVEIKISRTENAPKGGGREVKKTELGPFVVRIFNQKSRQMIVNTSNTVAGIRQTDKSWGFIADANADIKATASITDEVDAYGLHFKVIEVVPRYSCGVLTSIDGSMEVVR
jgi:hypothetical protein